MIFPISRLFSSSKKFGELIIFPSFCKVCSALLEQEEERVVCRSCLDKMAPAYSSCCVSCGRFFDAGGPSHLCLDCLRELPPFSRHRSCSFYRGQVKDIILLYKYRHFRPLGIDLARFAEHTLGEDEGLWWGLEAIVPVPLHPRRRRERGFNQAQVIAAELARLKGIESVDDALVKVKNVPPQTSLPARDRRRNIRGAFRVKKNEKIKGRTILLLDDVYTTGSTLRECSLALKKSGAKDVRALTIAQA